MYFERSPSGAVAAVCKRIRRIAVLQAILCLPVVVHAQTALTFDHITVDDGLSQNEVRSITQDKFGFLWFGASDGLNLYDGYQIRTYNHDPADSTSLLENFIGVMLTDSSGTLWIGTRRGLCLLTVENREAGRFERFEMAEVSGLMEARDGAVWVVTNRAILKYSKKGEVIAEFEYCLPVHEYGILRAAYQDRKGTIWFADGLTLCRFNAESIDTNHQPHFEYYPLPVALRKNREIISHVFQPETMPGHVLWVSTTRGLLQFDANEEKFTPISTPVSFAREMANRNIERIFEDSEKQIWVSSINFGLYQFAADLNSFELFWHNPNDSRSLSANRATAFYEDREGTTWIGTVGGGVNKVVAQQAKFERYKSIPGDATSLGNNKVWAFHEDADGRMWIGTGGGLYAMQTDSLEKTVFTKYRGNPVSRAILDQARIRTIYAEKTGVLWLGLWENGLGRLNTTTGAFKRVHYHGETGLNIYAFAADKSGNFWAGENGLGFLKLAPASERFTRYAYDPEHQSPNHSWVVTICNAVENGQEVLWLGTWKDGLVKFNPADESFTVFRHDPANPRSLREGAILALQIDHTGVLWIGANGNGLARMETDDSGQAAFSYFTIKDGLPNNVIYGIIEDDNGFLWLSSNKGLSKFNPRTGSVKNFDQNDGLQSNEFNLGAAYKNSKGELFFGGNSGFNKFYPSETASAAPPLVHLTAFKKFGKRVQLARPIMQMQEIILSHTDDFFGFEFVALHYKEPQKNKYAYMLQGFDREWIHIGARREATYTNLDPGNYVFRVKAANSDGVWNEKGTSIKVTILPPFWQTPLFYVALITLFAGILYTTHVTRIRVRVRQAVAVTKASEDVRLQVQERISKDFHDELGVRVTTISYLSKMLRNATQDRSSSVGMLDKIIANAERLHREHREFIWELDPRKSTIADLILHWRDHGTQFDDAGIAFSIKDLASEHVSLQLPPKWRRHLPRIFTEAMQNIRKHTTSCTKVSLSVVYKNDEIVVTLKDNGQGFHLDRLQRINGLQNMREHAAGIGGELEISSQPGKGTMVRFRGKPSERIVDDG